MIVPAIDLSVYHRVPTYGSLNAYYIEFTRQINCYEHHAVIAFYPPDMSSNITSTALNKTLRHTPLFVFCMSISTTV